MNRPMKWRLESQIADSGQAFVDLVSSPDVNGRFACKTFKNRKRSNRHEREVEALRSLHGLGIGVVEIVDVGAGLNGPRPKYPHFYVMPYYAKGSLEAALESLPGKPFRGTVDSALRAFYEVALTLRRVHERGVIHRDLKPANIMLSESDALLLADFGLVWSGVPEGERPTETNEQVGSRFYMAPEVLEGRVENPSPAADYYAMGKILAYMLTGNRFNKFLPAAKDVSPIDHSESALLAECVAAMMQEDTDHRKRGWDASIESIGRVLYPGAVEEPQNKLVEVPPKKRLQLMEEGRRLKGIEEQSALAVRRNAEVVEFARQFLYSSSQKGVLEKIASEFGWKVRINNEFPFMPGPVTEMGALNHAGNFASLRFMRPDGATAFISATAEIGRRDKMLDHVPLILMSGLVLKAGADGWEAPIFSGKNLLVRRIELLHPGERQAIGEACSTMLDLWLELANQLIAKS